MKIISILDKIKEIQKAKNISKVQKTRIIDLFEKYRANTSKVENLITETKKVNVTSKSKNKKKNNDEVIKELEKLLAKQEKEFLKVVNKFDIELDQDNMILATKKNIKKVENKIGAAGGLFTFNYSNPITRPLDVFDKDNPLDTHPLAIFIANVGKGSDGSEHSVFINIHHITSKYRKLFWNWILREYLISGKNNRRRLEIPGTLYYILLDNPEMKFALQGYRRYSNKQITNLKKVPLSEYENIFDQKYKARFKMWNQQKNKFVQRGK